MLYNNDIKEEFLSEYENENTQITIRHVFINSAETEEQKNKDLYDFTLEQIGEIMYQLNPKTTNSARTYGRFINYYIDWAIKHYRKGNISPLYNKPISYFDQYIDKSLKLLYTEEEIIEMEDSLINYQDKALVRLLFEAVEGDALSEVLNLQEKDIDYDNKVLHLVDDKKGERDLEVSERCLDFIKEALNKERSFYHYKNGNSKGRIDGVYLVENDYVIKTVNKKAKNFGRADKHLIYRRLDSIGKEFDYPYLNAKNIVKSGMLAMAAKLYVRDGELEKEQLLEIAERFNASKIKYNGNIEYNLTPLKGIIKIETLKELYPEIFEQ